MVNISHSRPGQVPPARWCVTVSIHDQVNRNSRCCGIRSPNFPRAMDQSKDLRPVLGSIFLADVSCLTYDR